MEFLHETVCTRMPAPSNVTFQLMNETIECLYHKQAGGVDGVIWGELVVRMEGVLFVNKAQLESCL